MTLPASPYELLLYGRDGRMQVRQFASLQTAVAAIAALRPALTRGYTLSIILETKVFEPRHDAPRPVVPYAPPWS
jgi:hypothetical protein